MFGIKLNFYNIMTFLNKKNFINKSNSKFKVGVLVKKNDILKNINILF